MATMENFKNLMRPLEIIGLQGANDPRIRTAITNDFRRQRERYPEHAVPQGTLVDLVAGDSGHTSYLLLHVYEAFPGDPPQPMTYSSEHQGYFIERTAV